MAENVVEFFGLSGSGKTTLCRNIFQQYRKKKQLLYFSSLPQERQLTLQNLGISQRYYKTMVYLYMLLFVAQDFFAFSRLIMLFLRHTEIKKTVYSLINYFLPIFPIIRLRHRLLVRSRADTLLLDHGLLQTLWSLATILKASNYQLLIDSFELFEQYCGTHLIYMKISPEQAVERIERRSVGISKFDRMPRSERLDRLTRLSVVCDLFVEKLQELEIPLLILDANQPVDKNIARIEDFLEL